MEIIKTDTIKQPYKTMNGEDVEAAYDIYTIATDIGFADGVIKEAQKSVHVTGFRRGKVPRAMLEKRVGINNLYAPKLTAIWDEFCAKNRILLGYRSELGEIHSRIDGAIVFSIITISLPIVELAIKEQYEIDATDEVMKSAGAELAKMREKLSVMKPVEDRKSIHGDYVTIDFSGKVNGLADPDLDGKDAVIAIGSRMVVIPGFEDNLIGIGIGESKEFELTFPENFGEALPQNPRAKLLSGKNAIFTVNVKNIQKKNLPSDEDLYKAEGKNNYAELYEEIVSKAFAKLQNDKINLANRTIDSIIIDNDKVLTDSLQKPTIDNRIMNFLDQHKESFAKIPESDQKQAIERIIPNITKSLYQDIVFAALLAKSGADVDPSEQDIEQEVESSASFRAMQDKNASKVELRRQMFERDYYGIYRNIQRHKTFQQLASKVVVKLDKDSQEYKDSLNPLSAQ